MFDSSANMHFGSYADSNLNLKALLQVEQNKSNQHGRDRLSEHGDSEQDRGNSTKVHTAEKQDTQHAEQRQLGQSDLQREA